MSVTAYKKQRGGLTVKGLSLTLLITLCLMPFSIEAEDLNLQWFTGESEVFNSRGEHFLYEVEDNRAILTCYYLEADKPQPAVVEVPANLGGYPLTEIGWCAFDNWDPWEELGWRESYDGRKVERIVIPEGVTRLGEGAFLEAEYVRTFSLPSTLSNIETGMTFVHADAEIVFPNGNECFRTDNGFLIDSRMESLIYCAPSATDKPLPRVRRIESHALENYVWGQGTLEFPDSVEYIGNHNAYDCTDLQTIIVPGSVREIEDYGLYCNSATNIILNEGLRRIGAFAFSGTDTKEIVVPASVEWIGYGAFEWKDLKAIVKNPNCVRETEKEYNTRIWKEWTKDFAVLFSSDELPMRKLEIVADKAGREFLAVTMRDGSDLLFVSNALPPFTTPDEFHASDTAILLQYPIGIHQDASKEDEAATQYFFLTFEYVGDDWRLTSYTNGQDWMADVSDGVFRFNDYYKPEEKWLWETTGEDRLTELIFSDLEEMGAEYDALMPDRYSLHGD
ncbi:MAG: leucine-rich repeat protein [Clostridia bacterium]|nr:leucine-rich repeat protein [Clostridia bacterium]